MDKRTVFADGLVLARAMKVLDAGVLVGEPRTLVDEGHQRRPEDGQEGARDRCVRPSRGRVEQNANSFFWGLDNWMYTANGDVMLRFKDGKFEVQKDVVAWRVGRHAGRCRPDLSEYERIDPPRRSRADAVLHAQSEPPPHARQLRALADEATSPISSGRFGRIRERTGRISSESIARTARSPISHRSARR